MSRIRVSKCPHCGEILAYYAHYKTKLCTRCGKKFRIEESIQYGVFDNAYEASEFVRKLKLGMKYGERE